MSRTEQQGYSLVELMISMVIFLIVVGAVLQLLSQSQQRNVATATAQDATAMVRDGVDQMVRELRLAGYPSTGGYPPGVISVGNNNMQYVATPGGFLSANNDSVQFEADLDDDGVVSVVNYQLQVPPGGAAGGCAGLPTNANLSTPTLMRSEVPKNSTLHPSSRSIFHSSTT